MKAELLSVKDLEPAVATYVAAHLCNPGSDMQAEFYLRRADTPVVLFSTDEPIAWVATHDWNDTQTLEAFTAPAWRRRGLARAGATLLLATSHLVREEPVALFSPDCVPLARSLRFSQMLLYERTPQGWRLSFG